MEKDFSTSFSELAGQGDAQDRRMQSLDAGQSLLGADDTGSLAAPRGWTEQSLVSGLGAFELPESPKLPDPPSTGGGLTAPTSSPSESAFTETTDVPETTTGAQPISVGEDVYAAIGVLEDYDVFVITLAPGIYEMNMESDGWDTGDVLDDPLLALYDAGVNLLSYNYDYVGDNSKIYYQVETTQTYYVVAYGETVDLGEYHLRVDTTTADQVPISDMLDWNYTAPAVIDVYLPDASHSIEEVDSGNAYTADALAAYETDAFMRSFAQYEAVSDLSFNIVTDIADADFAVFSSSSSVGGGALGYWSVGGGDIIVDGVTYTLDGWGFFLNTASGWNASGLAEGGDGYVTIVHELGHGLGLAHPHDNGGDSQVLLGVTSPFNDYGYADLNQQVYTIMSYNRGWATGPSGPTPSDFYGGAGGPMALDISYLQASYGANTATNSGNTVYTLNDVDGPGAFFEAIWDVGGTDWINAAPGSLTDAVIDLRPATISYDALGGGAVSYHVGVQAGLTIADGVSIENATGAEGDDTITGNDAGNRLFGGGGSDSISAGEGNDIIRGGTGGDSIDGGPGSDTSDYRDSALGVTVDLLAGTASGGDAQGDMLTGIERLFGSALADTLTGDGRNNILYGYAGNDTIDGGVGEDKIRGGDNDDSLLGDAGLDSIFGDDGNDILSGGIGDDNLWGGDGSDTIEGLEGFDTLGGGTGGDSLLGGPDADTVYGAAGDDTIYGDAGDDVLWAGVDHDNVWGGTGSDTIHGLGGNDTLGGGADGDSISGGADADTIYGAGGMDTILGDGGDDLLWGGGESDDIGGGDGADTLDGLDGDDTLDGGANSDSITGGIGQDSIIGGGAGDILFGEGNADRFVFAVATDSHDATGVDELRDFSGAAGEGDLLELQFITDISTAFIGGAAFSGGGGGEEVRFEVSGGNTLLLADTDGDGTHDFNLVISGVQTLTISDFA